jgi:asparagine synthase (glutamine-hydrolysing)
MPGIAGLITKMPRGRAVEELARMMETLRHESFYTTGTWIDESSGVYVGWTAQENCFSHGMPLQNERADVTLVFSGEEFPEPGTAQRLKQRGHELNGAEASYLVHLYEEDPSFLAGLNGRFHGLLTDQNRRTAVIFNDRYGMHRIYYYESPEAFYFAAEAKAILGVRPELRKLDKRGVGEFIACGCTLENRTLFEGLEVLPPASAWVFQNGSLNRKNSYFHPKEWEDQGALDPDSYYREIRQAFTRNFPRYFRGQQEIAMSLTGGLDTRMIMASRKAEPGSLACYTFGGMRRECQDVKVARQIARACGQSYQVIAVGDDFLSQFRQYAERTVYLSDGCVDVSRAPDLYLNERARDIAPVRMTGNYGGEVLRGVRTFKPEDPQADVFCGEVLSSIRQTKETYDSIADGHPVSFAVFKQAPWHQYGVLALEQTQLCMRSPYLDNDIVRTVYKAPRSLLATNHVSMRLVADGNRALLQIPTDRGLVVEGRKRLSSTISHALLEVLFKAEYGYDMGMPQWVAHVDHILSSLRLDRLFLGRHKIFHFRVWYRDALAPYVREVLLDPQSLSRSYIDRKRVESVLQAHLTGKRNYTTEIHKLLTLELLHCLFVDGAPASASKRPWDIFASPCSN